MSCATCPECGQTTENEDRDGYDSTHTCKDCGHEFDAREGTIGVADCPVCDQRHYYDPMNEEKTVFCPQASRFVPAEGDSR